MKAKTKFLSICKKQEELEKQLKELEDTNANEAVYDYDENGSRNGYNIVFVDKKVQRQYDKICKKLADLFDQVEKLINFGDCL